MRSHKSLTCFTLLLSVFLSARIHGADSTTIEQCPGATSWSRSHPASAGSSRSGVSLTIANVELLQDLQGRVERDQLARRQWLADPQNERLARAVNAIDAANLAWLRKLMSEKGFPTAEQVGNDGVHLAWVLLQHADQDPALQSELLPVLEERYRAGELPANDLARMTDRVLVASGKPQKYGTQFDWFSGEFKLPELTRLTEIDIARSRLGMMPLGDYICTIRKERENVTRSVMSSPNDQSQ
jgi:hypothetical protein